MNYIDCLINQFDLLAEVLDQISGPFLLASMYYRQSTLCRQINDQIEPNMLLTYSTSNA